MYCSFFNIPVPFCLLNLCIEANDTNIQLLKDSGPLLLDKCLTCNLWSTHQAKPFEVKISWVHLVDSDSWIGSQEKFAIKFVILQKNWKVWQAAPVSPTWKCCNPNGTVGFFFPFLLQLFWPCAYLPCIYLPFRYTINLSGNL